MNGERYRDTFASKGSALFEALQRNDNRAVDNIYRDTTNRYKQQYSIEDRVWFEQWNRYSSDDFLLKELSCSE